MRRSSNNGSRSSSGGGGNTLATTETNDTITEDDTNDPTLHSFLLNKNRINPDEEIEFYSDILGLSTNSNRNRNNQNQNRRNSNHSNNGTRRNSNHSSNNGTRRNSNNSGTNRRNSNNGSNPLLMREQNPIRNNSINFNTSHSALSDAVRSDLGDNENDGNDVEYEYEDDFQDDDTDAHSALDDGTINKKKVLIKEIKLQFKKERQIVTFWRRMFFITFAMLAAGLSWLTYISVETHQMDSFSEKYETVAETIENQIQLRWNNTINGVNELSQYLTSYANEVQQQSSQQQQNVYVDGNSSLSAATTIIPPSWPYISLVGYETLASNLFTRTSLINHITISPFVSSDEIWTWSSYSVINQGWITKKSSSNSTTYIPSRLYQYDKNDDDNDIIIDVTKDILIQSNLPAAPIWQTSPIPIQQQDINFNILSLTYIQDMYKTMIQTETFVTGVVDAISNSWLPSLFHHNSKDDDDNISYHIDSSLTSTMMFPIFNDLYDANYYNKSNIVGMILVEMDWMKHLDKLFLSDIHSADVAVDTILQSTCGPSYTFTMHPDKIEYIGIGDFHETSFNDYMHKINLNSGSEFNDTSNNNTSCYYSMAIYPTSEFYNSNVNMTHAMPIIGISIVWASFLLVLFSFWKFNFYSKKKYKNIISKAAESNKILSSLFPSNVRDRLFEHSAEPEVTTINDQLVSRSKSRSDISIDSNDGTRQNKRRSSIGTTDDNLFEDDDDDAIVFKTKPIADLFPAVTIMFTDLAGFTAWSSVREPSQVFILLESLYHAFDQIAKRRRVFKVETVGDCYVAVTGLPEPREDHAVVMARFANDCLKKTRILTKKLIVVLGPDTEDLTMRCGLHSGQVTAGVLRGERSRFQLFGDTMNTASRMESTGIKDRIQISQETADELISAGKVHWLTPREDKVIAKGKGEVETYWLIIDPAPPVVEETLSIPALRETGNSELFDVERPLPSANSDNRKRSSSNGDAPGSPSRTTRDKNCRLVDWNVEILLRQLKLICAARRKTNLGKQTSIDETNERHDGTTVLDEVQEVIRLPNFNAKSVKNQKNVDNVELPNGVEDELRDYVSMIAELYRRYPFHNFEHASHVTMSVNKLLARIVQPATDVIVCDEISGVEKKKTASEMHCFSYGITSDPLTHFACLFSALIHDVDHCGVPNTTLVQENPHLSKKYKGKSIAEQNSVDIAWDLLLRPEYKLLRQSIYSSPEEQTRFRQLVVNSVMATDIMDKDLKQLRNNRWEKAFSDATKMTKEDKKDNINRKATIVIEHLIQASDVAHTMQHWHIYRKWNERLFSEMLLAFRDGRTQYDPTQNWYEGELGFFDHYIIPLAKKLKDCGVFGVSSDEYLNYAQHNRDEFAERGKDLIEEMIQRHH